MSEIATSADVAKDFTSYEETAEHQPVIITKDGKPQTVLLAYGEFVRLSRGERRVELTRELDDAEIKAVERSVMAPGHEGLDAEVRAGVSE